MKILILGSGQDAGVPQINCDCENCTDARTNLENRRLGPSIAFYDKEKEYCYVIDASADLKEQVEYIKKEIPKVKNQERRRWQKCLIHSEISFGHSWRSQA